VTPFTATTRSVLRVRVPRCSRSSRKPRTSAFFFVASLFLADADRGTGATGSDRSGGSVSVKVRRARVARRWKLR